MKQYGKKVKKKILPEYYEEVRKHHKTFEIRKDEDDFQVGDIIDLYEWDGEKFTGHHTQREITYILRNAPEYGLMEGYCILAIQSIGWDHFYTSTSQTEVHQYGDNNTCIHNVGTLNLGG